MLEETLASIKTMLEETLASIKPIVDIHNHKGAVRSSLHIYIKVKNYTSKGIYAQILNSTIFGYKIIAKLICQRKRKYLCHYIGNARNVHGA